MCLLEALKSKNEINISGNPKRQIAIVSFTVKDVHAHDVASFLSHNKIAVRAGHHCTQPLHDSLGLPATLRVSFSIYNSEGDVYRLANALLDLKKFWR